jgi:predicted small secreted protein
MLGLRRAARIAAHLIVLLLAAVWATSAGLALASPLFDLARPRVGDAIIAVARILELPPDGTLVFAQALTAFRLALGLYLLVAVVLAACNRIRWGASDDAALDVALFLSSSASAIAALVFVTVGGTPLIEALGELILAALAGALASFGHGAQWPTATLGPSPAQRMTRIAQPMFVFATSARTSPAALRGWLAGAPQ